MNRPTLRQWPLTGKIRPICFLCQQVQADFYVEYMPGHGWEACAECLKERVPKLASEMPEIIEQVIRKLIGVGE